MFRTPIKESVSEYIASTESLDGIRDAARTALNETRMPEKDVDRIILALEEAATNVIRHSYADTTSGRICLKVTRYKKRIVLSLVDYGKPYFPEEKAEVSLDKLVQTSRRGGLGRLMIQRLMDDVEYIVGDDFNELRMTKFLDKKWLQSANMPNRAFGLRTKFSVATIGILVAITLGAYAVMETKTISAIEARLNRTMISLGSSSASLAETYILNGRSSVEFDELARSYSRQSEDLERVTIVSADGKILADTDNIRLLHKQYQPPDGIDPAHLDGNLIAMFGEKRFLGLPIGRAGRELGNVYMIYNTQSVSAEISEARESILLFVFFALLAGLVGIYFLSNYFVRPILTIIDRVRLFSERSEVADLPMSGAQEFFEISKALNQMMTRLRRDNVAMVERDRFMREAKVASEIQETLLPKRAPQAPGLDLGAHYRAASFVGGDLYDFFPTGPNTYCVAIADVSGKGVPASLIMSVLRTVVRLKADGKESPREILHDIEEYMTLDTPAGVFITLALAVYDSEKRTLRFVSAGHTPLIYYSAESKTIRHMNPKGSPIGLRNIIGAEAPVYEETQINVDEGDMILLYTDGASEIPKEDGSQVGSEGLGKLFHSIISASGGARASEIVTGVIDKLDEFRKQSDMEDDLTVIVGRLTERKVG